MLHPLLAFSCCMCNPDFYRICQANLWTKCSTHVHNPYAYFSLFYWLPGTAWTWLLQTIVCACSIFAFDWIKQTYPYSPLYALTFYKSRYRSIKSYNKHSKTNFRLCWGYTLYSKPGEVTPNLLGISLSSKLHKQIPTNRVKISIKHHQIPITTHRLLIRS